MAKKAADSGGVSKSQAIRDYISANPNAGPKAVAEALGAQGITVTAAFVSTVKSTDKSKRKKRRGRRPGRVAAAGRGGGGGGSDKVSMDTLIQAKKLAQQMGGVAKAKAALDAYARLVD